MRYLGSADSPSRRPYLGCRQVRHQGSLLEGSASPSAAFSVALATVGALALTALGLGKRATRQMSPVAKRVLIGKP